MKCANCNNEFIIDEQDKAFYDKIKVPEPTWCPDCRLKRRMVFRNERALYKNKCGLCDKSIISIYSPDSSFKTYCSECWYSDKWDMLSNGRDYNFNKPFFEQFRELQKDAPELNLIVSKNTNCEYANYTVESKNCYMTISAIWDENCSYGYRIFSSKDCYDCYDIEKCENSYECIKCKTSFNCSFCSYSESLVDCAFCYDCRNCQNCFGCTGLRGKQYCIFNKQYTKEEYMNKIKDYSLDSYIKFLGLENKVEDARIKFPKRAYRIINSKMCTGDEILSSKNCKESFLVKESEDLRRCIIGTRGKTSMDACFPDNAELTYEIIGSEQVYNFILGVLCWYSNDVQYSHLCISCNNLFGCTGLRNKEYCILNKQYTKEEYEEMVPKIIKHMKDMPYIDKQGREYKYGEFFPAELSPFAYNETMAHEYYPLTKEQALQQEYTWKDAKDKNLKIDISTDDIPDNIKDAGDIAGKIIECEHKGECNHNCPSAFRVTAPELNFYKKRNLPVPRLCPICRHYMRVKKINPFNLWHKKCMCNDNEVYKNTVEHSHGSNPCPNEFETSYSPDRQDIVYCEDCYKKEVI